MSLTKDDLLAIEKVIEKKLKPVKKDLKTIVNYFDHEFLAHDRRITRLEKHLHIFDTD